MCPAELSARQPTTAAYGPRRGPDTAVPLGTQRPTCAGAASCLPATVLALPTH
jgi:hypothetical protein